MSSEVAIIGMSCRFPGANDIGTFWQNIADGKESISYFSDDELRSNGVPDALLNRKNYIRSGFEVSDIEMFDAEFFGFTPREAQLLDPQHRLFLECAWHALEHAGHTPDTYAGRIGVYAGTFSSVYLLNIYSQPGLVDSVGEMAVRHANEKDYLATRVSYKLNLKGPSVSLQTSCSTSLVAVHTAVQSLLAGECDMALCGGVSLSERGKGTLHQTGGLLSPDGRCRPFDAAAGGTSFGSGLGVAVLKRLDDAVHDGNTIYAVIKGSAINNDGADKVGFTAPSANGQAEVILEALRMADTPADTVQLVEAHGTGTPLGDPIEIEALTRAWRTQTSQRAYCAIGSAKANVGHLGAAAGMVGLIKATLALHHRTLPPAINFSTPNPNIDFASSPFFVNTECHAWPAAPEHPRRAAVSSFGMGGTNAHLVLEEAPRHVEPERVRAPNNEPNDEMNDEMILLSARSEGALGRAAADLRSYLEANPGCSLRDVAETLRSGRRSFPHRAAFAASSVAQAIEILAGGGARRLAPNQALQTPAVAFLFPGQGSQYEGACRGLYASQPEFRLHIDRCCEILSNNGGPDLRGMMTGAGFGALALNDTAIAQPVLFILEYALARMLIAMAITPAAMLGHSVGEYVAATLAGVFSLEDALRLVALRGRLMQETAPGKMLSVALSEAQLASQLQAHPDLAIAATNGPTQCVVSGPEAALATLHAALVGAGVVTRYLVTSHAFHSSLMDPILDRFLREVESVALRAPSMPYVSNVTGAWVTADQATDPRYWRDHIRKSVRFDDGVRLLLDDPNRVLIEVGPGTALSGLVRTHPALSNPRRIVSLSRHPKDQASDAATLGKALGELWSNGVPLPGEPRGGKRIGLPGYPFERKRYWIDRILDAPFATQRPHETVPEPHAGEGASLGYRWVERPPSAADAAIADRPWTLLNGAGGGAAAWITTALAEGQAAFRAIEGPLPSSDVGRVIFFASDASCVPALEQCAQHLSEQATDAHRSLAVVSQQAVNLNDPFDLGADPLEVCASVAALAMRYPALHWTHLDVAASPAASGGSRVARKWLEDLAQDGPWRAIAWRGLRRYVLSTAPDPAPPAPRPLAKGHVAIADRSADRALAIANQLAATRGATSFAFALGEGISSWEQAFAARADHGDPPAALVALRARGAQIVLHPYSADARGLTALIAQQDALDAVVCQAASLPHAQDLLRSLQTSATARPIGTIACIVDSAAEADTPTADHYRLMAQARELEWTCGTVVSLLACPATTEPEMQADRLFAGDGVRFLRLPSRVVDPTTTLQESAGNGHAMTNGHAAASAHELADVEATVTEIWKTLFGVESVNHDDDFFAVGGTSLVAMQMIAQARERLGVELSIESLFEDPTVRGVTAQVKALLAGQQAADSAELEELLRLSSDEKSADELMKALLEKPAL